MTDLLTPGQLDPHNRFGAAAAGALPAAAPRFEPPAPVRSRRKLWWSLLAVIVAAGLGVGGYFLGRLTAASPGPRVVTVSHGIVAGAPITAGDLRLDRVQHPPAGAVTTINSATGATALRAVPVGGVLVASDLGPAAAYPKTGSVLVGVSVKPGQAPAQALQPGDYVVAVEPPPSTGSSNAKVAPKPVVLTTIVQVVAVQPVSGSQSVTLSVPTTQATGLGAQAGAGNVALLQVPAPTTP